MLPGTRHHGGAEIPVAAGKQRAVLAALLLDSGKVVTAEDLAGVLWGADPPPSAAASVQNYVKRLRRAPVAVCLAPAGRRDVRHGPARSNGRRHGGTGGTGGAWVGR
jgi:hypothetical protein